MAHIRIPAAAVILAAAAVTLHASSPKFFQAATQPEFLKGEVQNLSVDNRGQLALGPATDLVYETPAPFLWSLLPAADGSLYVGTGNEGKVFRVDAQGKATTLFDATELEVHALATAPNGGLYVGTSPNGKIYKVDRAGEATVFFDPGEKYIWALATDAQANVYAATGEKGIVYKIAPDGKGAPFYRSKATHVTALTFDKAGSLLVGTESPGRVLRVGADAKAFLLLDTPFQEIRAFRFDDKGMLYVAAVSGRPGSGGAPPAPADTGAASPAAASSGTIAVVTTEVSAVTVADTSTSGASNGSVSRDDKRAAKGAVYRIAPDGLWDELWQSSDDSPYDLVFDAQGRLVVATGSKGKIYRLEGDPPQPTLLTRASAQQVTALYKDAKGQLYYATANPGKLFRLSPDLAQQGTYESEPHDAQVVSSWGVIKWHGTFPAGTKADVSTRSGNTETPDETWSDWSAAYSTADGSAISSPKARFLQWRAVLSGRGPTTPVLTSVTAAYLQRNLRPEVHSVTVHPPGIVFQKPFSTGDPDLAGFDNQTTPDRKLTNAAMTSASASGAPSLGRRTYQKGLETLVWRADDENEDELRYEVDYRREGETAWRVLHTDLDEPIYVWDTTTVPNGTYFVKIVATDAPSNAVGTALTGELVSAAFEIDNTPPEILVRGTRIDGAKAIVTFDVTDDHSHIQRVEYSEDGQEWKTVFPTDGIADSRQEHYEVTLAGMIGPRGLSLRASDSMNNVATRTVDAR